MWYGRFGSFALIVLLVMAFTMAAPVQAAGNGQGAQPVCPGPVAEGFSRCHAWVLRPNATSSPTGLSPAQILSAYNFPTSSTAGSGVIIAIVDAYNDPNAESEDRKSTRLNSSH